MEKDKENKEKTFEDIGYSSWLCDTVKNKLQYDAPSDVQVSCAHICDLIKEGKFEHVLAQSKSGTGKTLAFLSIVSCFLENETIEEKIEEIESIHKPKVLILAPTREIAIQINDFAQFIMSDFPIKNISLLSCPVIGGLKTNETKANILIDKPLIVCGTLGRLIDMIGRKYISLEEVKLFIIDEADQICKKKANDKTFKQFQKIVEFLGVDSRSKLNHIQICAFSATFCKHSEKYITQTLMRNQKCNIFRISSDVVVNTAKDKDCPNNIKEYFIQVCDIINLIKQKDISNIAEQKCQLIAELLSSLSFNQAIIFYNAKVKGEDIASSLNSRNKAIFGGSSSNLSCVFFHGDQTQKERMKLMAKMKRLKIKVIVTTDLLARGIDLPKVNIVINFDYCKEQSQYLHRIGRTGRFGVNGVATYNSKIKIINKNLFACDISGQIF